MGNSIIVVKQILKFIEMVLKCENDFEISEFYPSRTFAKVENDETFLKFSNFLENVSARGSCPSSFPSGNQVDGSPLVAIRLQLVGSWRSGKNRPIYNFGVLSFEVMHSFMTVLFICIFPEVTRRAHSCSSKE